MRRRDIASLERRERAILRESRLIELRQHTRRVDAMIQQSVGPISDLARRSSMRQWRAIYTLVWWNCDRRERTFGEPYLRVFAKCILQPLITMRKGGRQRRRIKEARAVDATTTLQWKYLPTEFTCENKYLEWSEKGRSNLKIKASISINPENCM